MTLFKNHIKSFVKLVNCLSDNFFDRSSYLYEEPGNLLKQELRDPVGEDWKKSHKFAKNVE